MLLDERCEGTLRLGSNRDRDPRRNDVEGDEVGVVAAGDGVGEAERELGMRAAADGDHHAPDLPRPALLDDRDVARGVADDLLDRR
ncbi:MAG: hypothetical protein C0498_08120 [Anaerolinea sp.]|nr:hypothetical protein [Anaerolinea sp.]